MFAEDPFLLITGASGHTAGYFLERLKREKFDKKIKCIVRSNTKIEKINRDGLNIEILTSDFDDINSLKTAMKGVKTVLHTASIYLSEKLIEAGNQVGVEWFICVHTTGRYSKFKSASSDYIRIENNIIEKYKNVTILRPTMIYGSRNDRNMWKLIKTIYKTKFFPVFGSGKNLFQPVNAIDLGNAYYDVIKNKNITLGKAYNLSGRDKVSYISILREISLALNKKVFFIQLPNWFCFLIVYILNKLPNKIYRCPITEEQVLRMREDKIFSFSHASKDFGYSPMYFKDGIKKEVDDFVNNSYS